MKTTEYMSFIDSVALSSDGTHIVAGGANRSGIQMIYYFKKASFEPFWEYTFGSIISDPYFYNPINPMIFLTGFAFIGLFGITIVLRSAKTPKGKKIGLFVALAVMVLLIFWGTIIWPSS